MLRRKRDGWLTQLAGEAGCIQRAFGWQLSDCARARALNGSRAVAVSPDGAFVYVAAYSSDAIAAFRRDPATGALTQPPGAAGCVMLSGKYAGGRARPLRRPLDLAVGPDGRRLYVATRRAVTAFALRGGAPTQLAGGGGCATGKRTDGRLYAPGLNHDDLSLAVSPDGRNLYVGAGYPPHDALTTFRIR